MKTSLTVTASLLASSLTMCSVALAQPREKPRQLQSLRQYVGDWTSEVTSRRAVWTPQEKQLRARNHAELVLNDWFLQHIEVNRVVNDPQKVTKALWFQTFDARTEQFVNWYFQSTGMIGKSTGTWDQASNSFEFTPTDLPPNTTGRHAETFRNADTISGSFLITDADRQKLFDMVWTRQRQAGVAGQPTQEQWSRIATPIEPIPAEVKKLSAFIGEWDAEFIHRPSLVLPNGRTSKGKLTGEWILDGRFLLGRSAVGNSQSMWVIGYDTNTNAYRYILMSSNGQIEENIGKWNPDTLSFEWKLVDGEPGISRSSTNRVIGTDTIHSHIIATNNDGEIRMDLTIRSTRRK